MHRLTHLLFFLPLLLPAAEYEQPKWGGHKSPGYHTTNKSDAQRNGPQESPLGVLGAHGIFQVGSAEIKVAKIFKPGIAYRAGLEVGDRITHANGKRFEEATNKPADGGKGPREGLGYAIADSLREDRILTLTTIRGTRTLALELQLPKDLNPLADNYPHGCDRSREIYRGLCEKLLEIKGDRTHWSGPVQDATAGLALLAAGNLRWDDEIEDVAEHYYSQSYSDKTSSWFLCYVGTFLCEYYLATEDDDALERIEEIVRLLEARTSANGRHGHGFATGYNGSGINIISTHALLVWALARHCGIDCDREKWDAVKDHLHKSTQRGNVAYIIHGAGWYQSGARTGLYALALDVADEEDDRKDRAIEWLKTNTRTLRNSHACGLFGMIWGTTAMGAIDRRAFREHMDYWRWYVELGQAPDDAPVERYYIPSKGNCGGDYYLGVDFYNHAAMAMFFAAANGNLWVQGNRVKGWYSRQHLRRVDVALQNADKLKREVDAAERAGDYRKAHALLMELKEVEPNPELIESYLSRYRRKAENDTNRMLPYLVEQDYFRAYNALASVRKKYGKILAPRADAFVGQLGKGPVARAQIKAGNWLINNEAMMDVAAERIDRQAIIRQCQSYATLYPDTTVERLATRMLQRMRQ